MLSTPCGSPRRRRVVRAAVRPELVYASADSGQRPQRLLPGRTTSWSPDRRRVLQAAFGPELVQAAIDLQHRALADIALEALAVVTDLLDDVVDPLLVDAERLAHARRDAEDALDRRILALQHVVDVLRIDAILFGLEHRELRPAHDVL